MTDSKEAREIIDGLHAGWGPGLTMNDRVRYIAGHLDKARRRERERCAAIVRNKKPPEPRLWWLRDEYEEIAKAIESGGDL